MARHDVAGWCQRSGWRSGGELETNPGDEPASEAGGRQEAAESAAVTRGTQDVCLAFLRQHHNQPDAIALTGVQIAKDAEVSKTTVTRTLQKIFGEAGYGGYVAACTNGTIPERLAITDGDGLAFGTCSFQEDDGDD